ncbi:prephenate dehydratase [Candidatus Magnetaquicoccus inordinatus]|uniref:prephenate dehydratase n=1 Tax=Candidatus Magnetaquicoccus inordinatus TaxID=2496818 RepID=UPI00102C34B7|nr:prephenate dehydratase [Candidatus Magnetaquicoccus inordinatus]
MQKTIAFQGMRGAYSEQACREKMPGHLYVPCKTFEELFQQVESGAVDLGMLPVENSVAGTVSDSYDLLARHRLFIIGEHYQRVRHCLLGLPGSHLPEIRAVYSHPQALAQCHNFIKKHGWEKYAVYDTAGAAADLLQRNNPHEAALASALCAELYQLTILGKDIQDSPFNTTRFLLIARESDHPSPETSCKTSLLFEVRNIPAALYKCLGGFATNGINLTRLESRPLPGRHWSYQFYLDFEGHPEDAACELAMEEISFFTDSLKILGCYPQAPQHMD